jgi:hypothetical protein
MDLIWLSVLLAIVLSLLMSGCASTREANTKTTRSDTWVLDQVQTPAGPFGPVVLRRQGTDSTAERSDTKTAPEIPPVVMHALATTASGLGGMGLPVGLAGIVGAGIGLWRSLRAGRQRNELIEGVQGALSVLPNDLRAAAKAKLAAAASVDTQRVVWERT